MSGHRAWMVVTVQVYQDGEVVEAAEHTLTDEGESVEIRQRSGGGGRFLAYYMEHMGTLPGAGQAIAKSTHDGTRKPPSI